MIPGFHSSLDEWNHSKEADTSMKLFYYEMVQMPPVSKLHLV